MGQCGICEPAGAQSKLPESLHPTEVGKARVGDTRAVAEVEGRQPGQS